MNFVNGLLGNGNGNINGHGLPNGNANGNGLPHGNATCLPTNLSNGQSSQTTNTGVKRIPSNNYAFSSQSEPVSVDELEAILRDWNIEDGDAVLSVSSSNRGRSVPILDDLTASGQDASASAVDIQSWTGELVNLLGNCQSDGQAAATIADFLRAFETQATNSATQHRNRIANANRVLLKTLKRIHMNHKTQSERTLPELQRQVEEMKTRAEVAESRCKVLELHLQRAMDQHSVIR